MKVLTKPEDLSEKMWASGQLQWQNGWISPSTASSPGSTWSISSCARGERSARTRPAFHARTADTMRSISLRTSLGMMKRDKQK